VDPVRLRAIARKEWIQLKRDTRSVILAFVLPLFLLLFFGYAITWDVNDIPVAMLDQDRTPQSRALVEALESSGYFTVTEYLESAAAIDERLVGEARHLHVDRGSSGRRDVAGECAQHAQVERAVERHVEPR